MDGQFGHDTTSISTTKQQDSGDFDADSKRPRLVKTGDSKGHPILITPQYDAFQHLIAVGKSILATPQGVYIDENRGHIYVADFYKSRIIIFSETGDVVDDFRTRSSPYGVLVVVNRVYVTDLEFHKLSMFSVPDYRMISQVGGRGSGSEQFNRPQNLSLSPDKQIYVTDWANDRLQILDCNLHFQGSFRHHSMKYPVDIKFNDSQMFVLTLDSPCLKIFTHSGELVGSIITRGPGLPTTSPLFFCLDAHNNIVISDHINIKVFSSEGRLSHIIDDGAGLHQQGIAILKQTKLVSVSRIEGEFARLSIFSN